MLLEHTGSQVSVTSQPSIRFCLHCALINIRVSIFLCQMYNAHFLPVAQRESESPFSSRTLLDAVATVSAIGSPNGLVIAAE